MTDGEAAEAAALVPGQARLQFLDEFRKAVDAAEVHRGRFSREAIASRLKIAPSSVYAYLKGETLPGVDVLPHLLGALAFSEEEAAKFVELRKRVVVGRPVSRPGQTAGAEAASGPPAAAARDHSVGIAATVRQPIPRRLPPAIPDFVGRRNELALLDQLAARAADGTDAAIVVIDGTAGVGKTALAVSWSHQRADRYPDGQLYVDLRGFDRRLSPLDPTEALRGFLLALDVRPGEIPDSVDEQAALFRGRLADRRLLVLLDNARSSEDVRPLLPGAGSCLTIVTSRSKLESLRIRNAADRVSLGLLSHDEAVALLTRRIEVPAGGDWPELGELARRCARLPLALSIVNARASAADHPLEVLRELVSDLRERHSPLDVLGADEDDLDPRTMFAWSYEALSPPSKRLFTLLGLHPGPDIDRYACAALLAGREIPFRALRGLTGANLLTRHQSGRFAAHDLLREFARERAAGLEAAEAQAALERLLDYYIAVAQTADIVIQPGVTGYRHAVTAGAEPVPVAASGGAPASSGWPQPPIRTEDEARMWFEAELPTLLALIGVAAAKGFEAQAWRLAWALTVFLRRTGRRVQRAEIHRLASDAADRVGHRHARAASRRRLADALARLGQQAEADKLLTLALAEFEELGDSGGARQVHLSFSRVLESEQRYDQALHHARQALTLARAAVGPGQDISRGASPGADPEADAADPEDDQFEADPLAVADCLNLTSIQLCHLGHYEAALSDGSRALDLYTRIGHREGMANILRHLGNAEGKRGRRPAAIAYYEQSRQLDRELGDRFWEARVADHLADEYLAIGEEATARQWREQALVLLELLSHPEAEAVRVKLRGLGG